MALYGNETNPFADILRRVNSQYGGNSGGGGSGIFPSPKLSQLDALRARQKQVQASLLNPLDAPEVQNALLGIRTQLARGQDAALAQAKGRAAATGQAGFTGALAGSAARVQGERLAAEGQAASSLASQFSKDSRAENLDLLRSIQQGEQSDRDAALRRAALDAEIAKNNADLELRRKQDDRAAKDALELARLRREEQDRRNRESGGY